MTREQAEEAVRTLLLYVGENPDREGLKNTPARVIRAFDDYTKGCKEDPAAHLHVTFEDIYDEVVVLKDIPFFSLCEHHLAPIVGTAYVAYQPNGRIVGLSKLARLVEGFSRRLQIQERLTHQIAHTLYDTLNPLGVFVRLEAQHHCMIMRGVNKVGSTMVTSCRLGSMKEREMV